LLLPHLAAFVGDSERTTTKLPVAVVSVAAEFVDVAVAVVSADTALDDYHSSENSLLRLRLGSGGANRLARADPPCPRILVPVWKYWCHCETKKRNGSKSFDCCRIDWNQSPYKALTPKPKEQ
jgi:hypothetical protein